MHSYFNSIVNNIGFYKGNLTTILYRIPFIAYQAHTEKLSQRTLSLNKARAQPQLIVLAGCLYQILFTELLVNRNQPDDMQYKIKDLKFSSRICAKNFYHKNKAVQCDLWSVLIDQFVLPTFSLCFYFTGISF